MKSFLKFSLAVLLIAPHTVLPATTTSGVPVSYELPNAPGETFRVTLAIVDPKNPDWIISQFVNGAARTVTKENGGKFSETWDGLDDNFMPVPPGDYAVKGIVMPAKKWIVDGDWHSITPRFVTGAGAWMPTPDEWEKSEPFGGDPCGAPLGDIAIGTNGIATFCYVYLENSRNYPMVDLNKPVNHAQVLRAFNSGGAAGGSCCATDGETTWAFSSDGGPKFVFRTDQKSFGKSPGANRSNSYLPAGWVTAMAAWRNAASGKSLVAVAQRGKIIASGKKQFQENETDFVDKITIHDGDNGAIIATLPLRALGLAARDGVLYALHPDGNGFAVSSATMKEQTWTRVFAVPAIIQPADLELDSHGRFYLSDTKANKVFQLDRAGKILRTYGKLDAQKPGTYDRETFIAPHKLATWTDADGRARLIVVEDGGPNRASEWSDDGRLMREFLTLQTKCNDGYALDAEHPDHLYIPGQQHWLTRFKIDFEKRTWTVDAVWPDVGGDPRSSRLDKPQLIRRDGREYLACARAYSVYRHDGDRWLLSAAIVREKNGNEWRNGFWHDANGNGRVDDEEISWAEFPGHFLTYHGQNWLDDLSMVAMNQGGGDVWLLSPDHFDEHGNPVFKEFKKLFSDPVFAARAAGKADAVHGGNELANNFPSDWMQTDGSLTDGFIVQARGGPNFSANEGPQHKVSRYVPDGKGGFALKWRTGRTAMKRVAENGEMYGAMRVHRAVNGLFSVVDQSRCGVLLFNEDGLYVDTIFPDSRRGFTYQKCGVYPQPGEFFAGTIFPNRDNGKIYFAMGKYTPMFFEAEGWSLKENPVRPLTTVQKTVRISAAQIGSPPEIALSVRGGSGAARIARFAPALGGVAFDGSLAGWESCEPVEFAADKEQKVEVRCCYDPQHIYLRWHAHLASKFEAKPMQPIERIFSHGRLADTLSFYLQGDSDAPAGEPTAGRKGDVRFVFGVFDDGKGPQPVALGMYPQWSGANTSPQTYRSPVGEAKFAHVGAVEGAKLFHKIDDDGKGFVFVAAIPMAKGFMGGDKTLVNFEATFGGHNKFWWANSDGSANTETFDEPSEAKLYTGSWAPAQFQAFDSGVVLRNWQIIGPFGGPGAEKFKYDPNGVIAGTDKNMKDAVREFCEAQTFPFDKATLDFNAKFVGAQIRGYWLDPREVKWTPASIAPLDTRVILGGGGQVWYAATWIRVPAETELGFEFQGHAQTTQRWFVNGQPVQIGEFKPDASGHNLIATRPVTLRAGWNQIHVRAYCTGYAPFRAGLIVNGPPEKLWQMQTSATPQDFSQ